MKKIIIMSILLSCLFSVSLMANGEQEVDSETIVFADVSWDSVQVHNRIMAFIIENGLDGYKADFIAGDTIPLWNGLAQGDVDVNMESWHSNTQEIYDKGIESGDFIDLGPNYPDGPQGWWVPRYLVEGPDALAPGLKSVSDLTKYAHLFKDPEDPDKGIIYAGVAGWAQLVISEKIFNDNGLEELFNMGIAGSVSALAGTMVGAYQKEEPWCGYYWAPTAVLGRLDMIRLEGSEYDPAVVHIIINSSMADKAPAIVDILERYSTSVDDNNEFLAKMEIEGWDTTQTAEWFLKNKEDIWRKWVSDEVAARVKAAL